jgi:hypothetical protein
MSERRVYIAQLLCPQRHLILVLADEFDTAEAAERLRKPLKQIYEWLVAQKQINPVCALCQSNDFHIEIGRTRFRTVAEAKPELMEAEVRNIATQEYLKSRPLVMELRKYRERTTGKSQGPTRPTDWVTDQKK